MILLVDVAGFTVSADVFLQCGNLAEPFVELLNGEVLLRSIWHNYENPPADLTKYDMIESGMIDRYRGVYSDRLLNGEFTEEISEAAKFKEFISDYPTLYKALKEDIEVRIPGTKGLKSTQHNKELFSWGELADLDILSLKSLPA